MVSDNVGLRGGGHTALDSTIALSDAEELHGISDHLLDGDSFSFGEPRFARVGAGPAEVHKAAYDALDSLAFSNHGLEPLTEILVLDFSLEVSNDHENSGERVSNLVGYACGELTDRCEPISVSRSGFEDPLSGQVFRDDDATAPSFFGKVCSGQP